jgi:hypothetical protein
VYAGGLICGGGYVRHLNGSEEQILIWYCKCCDNFLWL